MKAWLINTGKRKMWGNNLGIPNRRFVFEYIIIIPEIPGTNPPKSLMINMDYKTGTWSWSYTRCQFERSWVCRVFDPARMEEIDIPEEQVEIVQAFKDAEQKLQEPKNYFWGIIEKATKKTESSDPPMYS